jgi:hypothetical protein
VDPCGTLSGEDVYNVRFWMESSLLAQQKAGCRRALHGVPLQGPTRDPLRNRDVPRTYALHIDFPSLKIYIYYILLDPKYPCFYRTVDLQVKSAEPATPKDLPQSPFYLPRMNEVSVFGQYHPFGLYPLSLILLTLGKYVCCLVSKFWYSLLHTHLIVGFP